MANEKKICISGIGVVSAFGLGKDLMWDSLKKGLSALDKTPSFPTDGLRSPYAACVDDSLLDLNNPWDSRLETFWNLAKEEALADAALIEDRNYAQIMGTSALDAFLCEALLDHQRYSQAEKIYKSLMNKKERSVIYSACASGNYALAQAYDLIKNDLADVVICGASDLVSRTVLVGFDRLRITSRTGCNPFDKNRSGTVIGEGAAVFVVESLSSAKSRGAKAYALISAYGLSCDAHSMTIPDPDGMARAMAKALSASGRTASEIDLICAHGTGTELNDISEAKAIKSSFANYQNLRTPVLALKSQLGHALGASSALEAAALCLCLEKQTSLASINYREQDENCNLEITNELEQKKELNLIMNNAFGFGGANASVILERAE